MFFFLPLKDVLSQCSKNDNHPYPVAYLSWPLIQAKSDDEIFKIFLKYWWCLDIWDIDWEGNKNQLKVNVYSNYHKLGELLENKAANTKTGTLGCFHLVIEFRLGGQTTTPDFAAGIVDLDT